MSLSPASVTAARDVFKHIRANLGRLSIDDVKKLLGPIFNGMGLDAPIVNPGHLVYRARRLHSSFSKAAGITKTDLIYPPRSVATLGRLNRPSESMFYCSVAREALFFELQDLKAGDEIIITNWRTTETMLLNNIGYTQFVFDKLGAVRPCPSWKNDSTGGVHATASIPESISDQANLAMSSDSNRVLRELLSEEFSCDVHPSNPERYKVTVAISELHLGDIMGSSHQFAGIVYPAMRMWANSDNLALLPWFVDAHLKFQKATHARIDKLDGSSVALTCLDVATGFEADGRLKWLGRILNWQVQPGQRVKFTVTQGPDLFGDYEYSKDEVACHWAAVDAQTGIPIEAT
jgi:hypothetical protein